jgi:glycosyltransferase involved in cell wall biosynthesis
VVSAGWGKGAPPEVSVVVSSYGRAGFLAGLLEALEAQELGVEKFEVVLVDNGSPDGTWAALQGALSRTGIRLLAVRLDRNAGAGGGRDAGLELARGTVVAFTDDDCLPAPGWLAALTGPLLGPDQAPTVVQGRTLPWPEDGPACGPWARTVWVEEPTWLFETCNIAYRRADLLGAGGFAGAGEAPRGATGRAFGEDALLGWAVVGAGATLVFQPGALVHHRHLPASYPQWLGELRGRGGFPALVGRSPFGRRALWHRFFLAPRTAATDLALVGLTLGLRRGRRGRRVWLLALLPWLVLALPEARGRTGRRLPVRLAQLALGDLVGQAWLAAGSVRHRTVVL